MLSLCDSMQMMQHNVTNDWLYQGQIFHSLQAGNVAAVRHYQETIVVNLMLRDPALVQDHVLPALLAYETR